MIYSEYEKLADDGIDFGLDATFKVGKFGEKCAVNDHVALKLTSVSPRYERESVIVIYQSDGVTELAYLVTCQGQAFQYGGASEVLAAAFLEDAQYSDIVDKDNNSRRDFVFHYDYLVISSLNHRDYISHYQPGSGLWGGFVHVEELGSKRTSYESKSPTIVAKQDVLIRSDASKDTLWRAIDHPSPLERYLKLYHLLELIFDLDLVKQIQGLGADLKGIGKLLNDYSGDKEFDRLIKVIKRYCPEKSEAIIESALALSLTNPKYHSKIVEMLFEYPKDSNPYLEKRSDFEKVLAAGFSKSELKNNKLSNDYNHLTKFAACMIYRVRCSIAHSKIGEYLLTYADEEFVAEVAEPLLRRILLEVYSA